MEDRTLHPAVKQRPERGVGEVLIIAPVVGLGEIDRRKDDAADLCYPRLLGRLVCDLARPAEPERLVLDDRLPQSHRETARKIAACARRRNTVGDDDQTGHAFVSPGML